MEDTIRMLASSNIYSGTAGELSGAAALRNGMRGNS